MYKEIRFNCGKTKEDYESAYCDKCWKEEQKRFNTSKLTIKNKDNNKSIELDFDSLDFGFGLGDYFYNGNCTGSQIGFCWSEELGQRYIEHLYLNLYIGNEEKNDLYTCETYLNNLTSNKELLITLSNVDYNVFISWYKETNIIDFHYYSNEEIKKIENYKNELVLDLKIILANNYYQDIRNKQQTDFFHYQETMELATCKYGTFYIASRGELKVSYTNKEKGLEDERNIDDIQRYYITNDDKFYEEQENGNLNIILGNWFEIELVGKDGEYIENLFTNEVYGDIQECLKDIQDYMRASKVEELEQSIIEYLEEKGEVIMKEDYTSIYDDGEQYEEDLEELKGIISSNLENYLNGIIEEWVDWVRDNGGSRVKTYADIIDYLYEDILDDYMISDNIENNEIKRQIKYAVANYEPTDFENRRDLEIYVISI